MNGAAGLPMMSAYEWFSITTTTVCAGSGTAAVPADAAADDRAWPAGVLPAAGPEPPHPVSISSTTTANSLAAGLVKRRLAESWPPAE